MTKLYLGSPSSSVTSSSSSSLPLYSYSGPSERVKRREKRKRGGVDTVKSYYAAPNMVIFKYTYSFSHMDTGPDTSHFFRVKPKMMPMKNKLRHNLTFRQTATFCPVYRSAQTHICMNISSLSHLAHNLMGTEPRETFSSLW